MILLINRKVTRRFDGGKFRRTKWPRGLRAFTPVSMAYGEIVRSSRVNSLLMTLWRSEIQHLPTSANFMGRSLSVPTGLKLSYSFKRMNTLLKKSWRHCSDIWLFHVQTTSFVILSFVKFDGRFPPVPNCSHLRDIVPKQNVISPIEDFVLYFRFRKDEPTSKLAAKKSLRLIS